MRRNKLLEKLTLLALMLLSANSQAEIVKYNFTAQGYDLTWGPECTRFTCTPLSAYGDHHLATRVNPTSTLTGSFFYDTDAKKSIGSYNSLGVYSGANVTGSMFTTDTGFHYATDPADGEPYIWVSDNPVDYRWGAEYVKMTTSQTDSYGDSLLLSLTFTSKVGNGILPNTDLPAALSLDDFNGNLSLFWSNGGAYQFFYANITTMSLVPAAPVPEPATYAMFGVGLACLGMARRRQQRRQAA